MEEVKSVISQNYGTLGPAFLECLVSDPQWVRLKAERIKEAFFEKIGNLTDQDARVADRFALVAIALGLAEQLIYIDAQSSMDAVIECFHSWKETTNNLSFEEMEILKRTVDFVQKFGISERFSDWYAERTGKDHAGYHGAKGGDGEEGAYNELWIIPAVFKAEICRELSLRQAIKLLKERDILIPGPDRSQVKKYGKGWFYVIDTNQLDSLTLILPGNV